MPDLKPMELGEILDASLTIFRRHFALFVQLGVAALWLPVAATVYVQLSGGSQQHIGLTVLITIVQYFAGLFLTAGAIRIISDSYLGREPVLGDALSLGAAKVWPLFLVGLGKGLVIGIIVMATAAAAAASAGFFKGPGAVGAFAAVVLGAWFAVYVACGYAVTTPVVVLEHLTGSFDAFGRSWELTRTFRRKIFAIALVAYLIFTIPIAIFGALAGYFMVESPALGQAIEVISAVLPIVLTPLLSCVFTLIYYDLRVRREAFDLQVLSEQLGIA